MKRIFSTWPAGLALLALGTGCHPHFVSGKYKFREQVTRTGAISSHLTRLDVENKFGSMRITGTDQDDAHWTATITILAESEAAAKEVASQIQCEAGTVGTELKLRVHDLRSGPRHNIQCDFDITAPRAAEIAAQGAFGPMNIDGFAKDVTADDMNGEVYISNVQGHVRATTSFAGLNATDTGAADLTNQNGTIEATRIAGPVNVKTSFGSVVAKEIKGAATLINQNGEVKANAIRGPLDIRTSFGGVTIFDADGPAAVHDLNGFVEAVQIKGDVDIATSFDGLSVDRITGNARLANQNGGIFANGVSGTVKAETAFAAIEIKGAGPEFICQDQNGAVRLRATSAALTNVVMKTSFGLLELHLPAGAKPALAARTSFGDVQSDFPVLAGNEKASASAGLLRADLRDENGNIRVFRD